MTTENRAPYGAQEQLAAHDGGCDRCSTLSAEGRCAEGNRLWWAFMRAPSDSPAPAHPQDDRAALVELVQKWRDEARYYETTPSENSFGSGFEKGRVMRSCAIDLESALSARAEGSEPRWYTRAEMHDHLKGRNYSEQIASELADLWADHLEGARNRALFEARREAERAEPDLPTPAEHLAASVSLAERLRALTHRIIMHRKGRHTLRLTEDDAGLLTACTQRLSRAERAEVSEPDVMLGVGDGSGSLFVHGSWEAIDRVRGIIFENERLRAEPVGALRAALRWALDLIDMYDAMLATSDEYRVYGPVHLAGKAKARAALGGGAS